MHPSLYGIGDCRDALTRPRGVLVLRGNRHGARPSKPGKSTADHGGESFGFLVVGEHPAQHETEDQSDARDDRTDLAEGGDFADLPHVLHQPTDQEDHRHQGQGRKQQTETGKHQPKLATVAGTNVRATTTRSPLHSQADEEHQHATNRKRNRMRPGLGSRLRPEVD